MISDHELLVAHHNMPSIEVLAGESKKRKRAVAGGDHDQNGIAKPKRKISKSLASAAETATAQIALLEEQIKESQRHYNNIQSLLITARKEVKLTQSETPAVLALCRVFCRLLADGRLSKSSAATANELKILQWLKDRYSDYQHLLFRMLEGTNVGLQRIALHAGMQLVKEEIMNGGASAESIWRTALFPKLLNAVLSGSSADDICGDYLEKYVNVYDDVRHYTFMIIV